jgi:hypothetical protein
MISAAHCDLGAPYSIIGLSRHFIGDETADSAPTPQNRHQRMQRNRFTQTITLGDRLAHEAERLRQNARKVPIGKERESLLRKARQLETASHINEWLSSPGLQTPQ